MKFENQNLVLKHCNISDIQENGFDLVILAEVIEHLPDVGGSLAAINGLTEDKGILFISTDNAFYLQSFIVNLFYSYTKCKPKKYLWHHQSRYYWWNHHIYTWTLSSLSTLLALYGFSLVDYWFSRHDPNNTVFGKLIDMIGMVFPGFRRLIVLKFEKTGEPTIVSKSPFKEVQKLF